MADCGLTTARKGKTMTKHMPGDSEVERDLRKMKTAPQALTERTMTDFMRDELGAPKVVDRSTFHAELDALRIREKAHTREGDAIAAARRRLPMVEVDGATPLIGERGAVTLLDVFEGRRMCIAYHFIWQTGHPAPGRVGSTMPCLAPRVRLARHAGCLFRTTDSFPCCRRMRKASPCVISRSGTMTVGMK